MSVLEVRVLSKAFGGVRAVSEVSFKIGEGEFLAMIGPNGAGNALRERQHQQQDDEAQQRAPIFGLPHHRVLQGGKYRGADDRPA